MNTQFAKWPCLIVVVATLVSGCATKTEDVKVSPEERAQRLKQGYVYYLDGAGGGGTTNWLGGVRNGLLKAGYDGSGEMFSWETGKGVVADQESSNEYKKEKAAELASQIQAFRAEHGDVPITLIGFSAGTAVATFTLETLPEDVRISDVILLGGSLSTSHDLTNALKRIDNRLYIFTSRKDAVLQLAIPLSGAADRDATTTDTVGVDGPQVPEGASEETRELYADKVIVIPRTRKAEHYGDEGGHTDAVGEDFVRHYVAPLVNTKSRERFSKAKQRSLGKVPNPDYTRWADFEPGSWSIMEGTQSVDGKERPFRVKTTLVEKFPASLIIERVDLTVDMQKTSVPYPQYMYVRSFIDPSEHPRTSPESNKKDLGKRAVTIKSNQCNATSYALSGEGDFDNWGSHPEATLTRCNDIPGRIVELELNTHFDDSQFDLKGKIVDFYVIGRE